MLTIKWIIVFVFSPNERPEGNSSLMSNRFPKTLRNSKTIIISPNRSDGSFNATGVVMGRSCEPIYINTCNGIWVYTCNKKLIFNINVRTHVDIVDDFLHCKRILSQIRYKCNWCPSHGSHLYWGGMEKCYPPDKSLWILYGMVYFVDTNPMESDLSGG